MSTKYGGQLLYFKHLLTGINYTARSMPDYTARSMPERKEVKKRTNLLIILK